MLFFNQVKYDYLQRIRSYRFLVILGVSLALGFLFIPAVDASYETITIGNYKGQYNSAWIGVVSAVMASAFVSMLGFYVINNSLKKDIETKVGQIIATTQVTNFRYLFSKVVSNFLVLSTMVLMMALMNVGLFFLYNTGFAFEPLQFILPYLLIPIPAMFFIASLAVVLEVVFKQKSTLQNIGYFMLFGAIFVQTTQSDGPAGIDPFGTKLATTEMIAQVNALSGESKEYKLNIGFRLGDQQNTIPFLFKGVQFSLADVGSRIIWMLIGILLTLSVSPFFHRFSLKERLNIKKKEKNVEAIPIGDLDLGELPKAEKSYGLWPLLRTEFLLLIRQGSRWLWGLNLVGMALLVFLDLEQAHVMVLPLLWFLQVGRWSELTTKERQHNVHQVTFTAYKPISRVYAAQLLAGIGLGVLLALPLIVRHLFVLDFAKAIGPVLGSIFLIGLSALSAIISQGKKLFEMLFFFVVYGNINRLPFLDYFGGVDSSIGYLSSLLLIGVLLLATSIACRGYQLRNL